MIPKEIKDTITDIVLAVSIVLGGIILLVGLFFGVGISWRHYNVWSSEMSGKAKLAEATQSRMIQVEQAKGELEAAKLRARAIEIVGEKAKLYPEYIRQEYIGAFAEALKEGKIQQIMYIPTETGLPITEANRLNK